MWAISILISLAIIFLLLLCVPLDLTLCFNTDKWPKLSMRLVWLFGFVKAEVQRKKLDEKRAAVEHEPKPGKWRSNFNITFEVLRTKGMPKQTARLFRSIFKHLKIRELVANFKIGLDNPADTGLLFAFIAPITLFASSLPYQIKVEPSFAANVLLQGHFSGTLRMQPIYLMAAIIGFAFSLPAIRALKAVALLKWRRK